MSIVNFGKKISVLLNACFFTCRFISTCNFQNSLEYAFKNQKLRLKRCIRYICFVCWEKQYNLNFRRCLIVFFVQRTSRISWVFSPGNSFVWFFNIIFRYSNISCTKLILRFVELIAISRLNVAISVTLRKPI